MLCAAADAAYCAYAVRSHFSNLIAVKMYEFSAHIFIHNIYKNVTIHWEKLSATNTAPRSNVDGKKKLIPFKCYLM